MFDDIDPDWLGIVRDLRDPQREKNKRRSQQLEILNNYVWPRRRYEKGAIENEEEVLYSKDPNVPIIMAPDQFDKYMLEYGTGSHPQLEGLDDRNVQDIRLISGIPTEVLGIQETSRESGRTVALRQQQGVAQLVPFQDNMRITRKMVAKQVIKLISQLYTEQRIIRYMSDTNKPQFAEVNQRIYNNMGAIAEIKRNIAVDKYDVVISETPSSPTNRMMEYQELMALLQSQILPPTPGILKLVIQSSDISMKNELTEILEQEMQKAAEQQDEQMVKEALVKGGGGGP
jgi:hypothetical protein